MLDSDRYYQKLRYKSSCPNKIYHKNQLYLIDCKIQIRLSVQRRKLHYLNIR